MTEACLMTYCASKPDPECPSGFCALHCRHNDSPSDTTDAWRKGSYGI